MATDTPKLWYVAYGSNMSTAKFTGSRGIKPICSIRVRIPGFRLAMQIPGVPYSEPSFASITPRTLAEAEKGTEPDVIGVAYLILQCQYKRVIASEGGGIAYRDIRVLCEPLCGIDRKGLGDRIEMRTLATAMLRKPAPLPSQRYMAILEQGSRESQLPLSYQQYLLDKPKYQPPTSFRTKLGARIFATFWGPMMAVLEKVTRHSIQDDGTAHWSVVIMVRSTMFIMWVLWHDCVFAPIFGRGDGLLDCVVAGAHT
ncbi:hypothetical protein N0V93_004594 [Gnomoniopsis smithogilvyi]|uniref:gamma-glutamylcyclotransferase n=1 Tax=Gnomoniopsis smithogilvyi TaxID=1191159 RepID=A0A9W9CX82_9PEZI|nr:hypothetical protein N0V93_004594 [Gnomoniopsis smithogilvyi]